jgi:hypothetical protein
VNKVISIQGYRLALLKNRPWPENAQYVTLSVDRAMLARDESVAAQLVLQRKIYAVGENGGMYWENVTWDEIPEEDDL